MMYLNQARTWVEQMYTLQLDGFFFSIINADVDQWFEVELSYTLH